MLYAVAIMIRIVLLMIGIFISNPVSADPYLCREEYRACKHEGKKKSDCRLDFEKCRTPLNTYKDNERCFLQDWGDDDVQNRDFAISSKGFASYYKTWQECFENAVIRAQKVSKIVKYCWSCGSNESVYFAKAYVKWRYGGRLFPIKGAVNCRSNTIESKNGDARVYDTESCLVPDNQIQDQQFSIHMPYRVWR